MWIDLTADGLDQKLLLRGDGTSVYMTQDLGTALRRFEENNLDDMIYVVGNEQNYHFQVLKLVLKKLGYTWSDNIFHLSYGMVELPEGKMKSREGTVVDADDLIADMVRTAREMSAELGKLDGCTAGEADEVSAMVGLGALKYFIPKSTPRRRCCSTRASRSTSTAIRDLSSNIRMHASALYYARRTRRASNIVAYRRPICCPRRSSL